MPKSHYTSWPLLFALGFYAGVCGALVGQASAQVVGKVGAVNAEATANGRSLSIGSAISFGETIKTSDAGALQIIFADRTTLSVGHNSTITIDEFVFDPSRTNSRMSVKLITGTLRVIGGDSTHNGAAKVTTPVATVGIRGGVAVISHKTQTSVYNHYGWTTVSRGGQQEVLYRPGFGLTVSGGGPGAVGAISSPVRASPSQIGAAASAFVSTRGHNGGHPRPPTEAGIRSTVQSFGNSPPSPGAYSSNRATTRIDPTTSQQQIFDYTAARGLARTEGASTVQQSVQQVIDQSQVSGPAASAQISIRTQRERASANKGRGKAKGRNDDND